MMASVSGSCCLLLIMLLFPLLASSFMATSGVRIGKRSHRRNRNPLSALNPIGERKLFFKRRGFQTVTVARRHQSTYLECEAGGSPSPTIHWLKDGIRLPQGSYEMHDDDSALYEDIDTDPHTLKLRLSSTKSRLYIDCPTRADEGEYTCVTETPYMRKTQSTVVKVESRGYAPDASCMTKRSERGEPARVYMWTTSRLEFEETTVQFFCRASGYPEPSVTWYDGRNNSLPGDSDQYSIAVNGDLLIRDITWMQNMGAYRCQAENIFGSHSVDTFLYPTTMREASDLPA